jgi:O-antigen chain-terminating methyltransferase
MIAELVSRLPEIYQPVFGHPELSTVVSRACEDRLEQIAALYRALEARLQRPLRVLDLGCAQGFFSLSLARMGATVLGVDFLDANIAVCRALADEQAGLEVRFEVGRLEEVVPTLQPDQFDLVLGLSVLHHVVHESGVAAVQQMLAELALKVSAGIFELALASEPLYWGPSQAQDPRDLLQGFAFVHELARFDTHLSDVARPLYVASQRFWFLNGQVGLFERWQSDSHQLAPGAHQGSRRYFFGEQHIVKMFRLDHAARGALNSQEFRQEALFLRTPPPDFAAPALLLSGENASESWLVREHLPGELLIDRITAGKAYDARRVLLDVLTQLAALEAAGLFHNDVRTWNVLIGPAGDAHLIDYGAISPSPTDCMWPHDIFMAFFIFVEEVCSARIGSVDTLRAAAISPYRLLPPYRQWGLAFWATPADQWCFRLMVQLFVRIDSLAESPAPTQEEGIPLQRWIGAVEENLDVQLWFSRNLRFQQSQFVQQSAQRESQWLAAQGHLHAELAKFHAEWAADKASAHAELAKTGAELANAHAELAKTGAELANAHAELAKMGAELANAQAKVDEFQQLSHRWGAEAERRGRALQDVYSSLSWRITGPLRLVAHYVFTMARYGRRAPGLIGHRAGLTIKSVAVYALRPIVGNQALKLFVLRKLVGYPRVLQYLGALAMRFSSLDDNNAISSGVLGVSSWHAESTRRLSPRAARLFVELKQAIEARKD